MTPTRGDLRATLGPTATLEYTPKELPMKSLASLLCCLLGTFVARADNIPKGEKVEFKTFTRPYFEKNNSGLKGEESLLAVTDQEKFDAIFGVGFVMGKKPDLLSKDAFEKQMVLSVIKRGSAITTYAVKGVTETDGTLYVDYTAETGAPSTAKFASPVLIAIPKGKYKSVVFVENGKKVGTVEIGK